MKKSIYNSAFLLIILLFLQIEHAFAQIPDAELINQTTDIVVKNEKLNILRSFEIRINNRSGEKQTHIYIPYSKLNRVSNIEACIKDNEGSIVKKLKSGELKDRSVMANYSLYEDNFVKEFTLRHNVYPYSICYSYVEQQNAFFYIVDWSSDIDDEVPSLNAKLSLEVPLDYKISYKAFLVDNFSIDTLENSLKYNWKASCKKPVNPEIYSPVISDFMPNVFIVPNEFKYDQEGSYNSWNTYGNWQFRLIEGLSELPESEKDKIHSLIDETTDTKEKIKILYHYLQDATRYINISIETGGMKPYPASYVAENKYGDCKALSNYFKSVLSYLGISSFYTNVYAGEVVRKVDQNFPSPQFNHIILFVPLQNDTIWLDCTSDKPFNYLGTFTQNRAAFLVDKNNSRFTQTAPLTKNDVKEVRTIHVYSDSINGLVANFHNTYRGKTYERLFDLSRSVSESMKSQIIRNDFIETGLEMLNYNLIPSHRDSALITLNYKAKADKLYKIYGKEQLIRLIPFSIPPFKEPKNRKLPVQLNFPIYKIDTLEYAIPDGYAVFKLPEDQSVNSPYGSYNTHYFQKDNYVKAIKSFVLFAASYNLDKFKDFYPFVKNVFDIENNSYIITNKKE